MCRCAACSLLRPGERDDCKATESREAALTPRLIAPLGRAWPTPRPRADAHPLDVHQAQLLAFVLAGICAAMVGIVFGLPSLRIKGFYLAVATLAAEA